MENAGRQAALLVEHLFPRGRVVGLVGSGNNGGDALVALRTLAAWGREVAALVVGRRTAGEGVLHGWEIERIAAACEEAAMPRVATAVAGAGVILDGLLGTGVRGAPREATPSSSAPPTARQPPRSLWMRPRAWTARAAACPASR